MIKSILVLRNFADGLGKHHRILIKKLQRGTVSFEEMVKIAEALDVGYEQAFVLPDGEKIQF